MPTKKPIKSQVRTSSKAGSNAVKTKKFKIMLGIIGLVIALVGGLVIYRSFAGTSKTVLENMTKGDCNRLSGKPSYNSKKRTCTVYRVSFGFNQQINKALKPNFEGGGDCIKRGGTWFVTPSGGRCEVGKNSPTPDTRTFCQRNPKSCQPKNDKSSSKSSGNSAPVIPNCKWNQSIKENHPNCQPPWPPEVALAESNQWTPVPMYLAYPAKETTTTTAVDLSSGPNGMNNWNVGPKYDTPGNISGAVAFNDMKDQRYWYTSSGMAVGQARPYANVLICAEASGIGTIKINVANTDNKQETIASFNVNQASRTLCGAYPQSKITNFSVAAESRLGYPVKINKVSMKLLLQ